MTGQRSLRGSGEELSHEQLHVIVRQAISDAPYPRGLTAHLCVGALVIMVVSLVCSTAHFR